MKSKMEDKRILGLKFNQTTTCFASAMDCGLRIFSVNPLEELAHYGIDTLGSIAICEMFYSSNIIAIVSGGNDAKFPNNVLHIYDCEANKKMLELRFSSSVKNVLFSNERLVVILLSHIHIFSFPSPVQKLLTVDTPENPLGWGCINSKQQLFYPSANVGVVAVLSTSMMDFRQTQNRYNIDAHITDIVHISASPDGNFVATASKKGTLIRVFYTTNGDRFAEFRRGSDDATIFSINFSQNSDLLCCSSDTGTLHVFAIKNQANNKRLLARNLFGDFGVSSQWSFNKFRTETDCVSLCGFVNEDEAVGIYYDGSIKKFALCETREGHLKSERLFLDACNEHGL